jgi:peptidoglycan/LPS O-acetylase OafA/YrhL
MSMSNASRSRELDALRGIAASWVLLFHYTVRYGEIFGDAGAPFHAYNGGFGVELFFAISGFVMLMTLSRMRTAGEFIIARAARLYPTYWAGGVVTFIVMALWPLAGRTVTLPQALFNLTMLQEYFHVPDVDSVYWSLEVELVFYAWIVAVLAAGWLPRARALVTGWMLLGVAAYLGCRAAGRPLPVILDRVLLLEHCGYFGIGVTAFLDYQAGRASRASWLQYGVAVAVAFLAQGPKGGLLALAIVAVFWLVSQRRAGALDTRVLVFLGAISYPLYLLHQNIGYAVMHGLRAQSVGYGWAMAAAIAVSLAGATALHYAVEVPVRDRFQRWSKRRRAAVAPAVEGAGT